jgi:hypothetical protein
MTDAARLEEIEKRCNEATRPTHDELRPLYSGLAPQPDGPASQFDDECYFALGALARFRDEMQTDVPWLLAKCRGLIAENERLREVESAARNLRSATEMTGMMSSRTSRALNDLDAALAAPEAGTEKV